MVEDLGIYVHIPYCYSKCSYCDFNSYAMGGSGRRGRYAPAALRASIPTFIDALRREISAIPVILQRIEVEARGETGGSPAPGGDGCRAGGEERRFQVSSIFFGGGTPSVLEPGQLAVLLDAVRQTVAGSPGLELASDAEISLEANPESLAPCKHEPLIEGGFNRISIGVQSTDLKVLRGLGRPYGAAEALSALSQAKATGWPNINVDLIYGAPGQNLSGWRTTLDTALSFVPDHVSVYALTLHEGTPLGDRMRRRLGSLAVWEDLVEDEQAAMYDSAVETLAGAGYRRYETSNFALPGKECRHNALHWKPGAYIGIGPGAHSHLPGERTESPSAVRWSNVADIYEYLSTMTAPNGKSNTEPAGPGRSSAGPAVASIEVLSHEKAMSEAVFLSLRTANGLDLDSFAARFGADFFDVYPEQWERLSAEGLIGQEGRAVRLSSRTALVANQVLCEFV